MLKMRIFKKRHKILQYALPCVFFIWFLFVVLAVSGDILLKILLGNKESSDRKQTCYADYAYDVADCVGVVDDNVSCDCKDKNLEGVCRSKVDKHAHKLKSDYDGKHVV